MEDKNQRLPFVNAVELKQDETISKLAAINALMKCLEADYLDGYKYLEELKMLPEVQLSPIEQALHGRSPEEQADFLRNLMKSTRTYTDSRAALIRWLERGNWNESKEMGI